MSNGIKSIAIVGLGYVGLPLALTAAERGFQVIGIDINSEHITRLSAGTTHFRSQDINEKVARLHTSIEWSTDPRVITKADAAIICVPTPVDEHHKPDLHPLIGASKAVAENMHDGQLIVVESTISPGTMEDVILPILENNGKKCGQHFNLAHCPERIDIGNKKYTLTTIPRVIGGITKECTERAAKMYEKIIDAKITRLNTIKAAETAKVVENTFRDVNIALVNELARAFDAMGIDIMDVIRGASTKPFAFLPHYPGCGVGGHCIPVDPYYLIERSRENGFTHRFLSMARTINEEMPEYTVQRTADALKLQGKRLNGAKIAVLGIAYKAEIDDIRESPALVIIEILKKSGASVAAYDPHVPASSTVQNLSAALSGKDCIIIATDHNEFRNITAQQLRAHNVSVVIDGRNCLDKEELIAAGIIYRGIGR